MSGRNEKMVNMSINVPQIYVDMVQKMIDLGIYPSRSEAMRCALKEFIQHEIPHIRVMEELK